jgi:hypothetical protein
MGKLSTQSEKVKLGDIVEPIDRVASGVGRFESRILNALIAGDRGQHTLRIRIDDHAIKAIVCTEECEL